MATTTMNPPGRAPRITQPSRARNGTGKIVPANTSTFGSGDSGTRYTRYPHPRAANRDRQGAKPAARPERVHVSLIRQLERYLRSPKGMLLLLFLPLLAVAGTTTGWSQVAPHLGSAVAGACVADLVLSGIFHKKLIWPSGALLTGMILAFVLGVETPWPLTLTLGALAVGSKYALRWGKFQLVNPAGLALLAAVPLFATGQSWWGALGDLPVLWSLLLVGCGVVVVDRINKFPLVLSFTGVYFGLLTLVSLKQPVLVTELFRAPFVQSALFLALFMLTDPPTSPNPAVDQVWIGALVAAVSVAAQLLGAGQTYLLVGLIAGNIALAFARAWHHHVARG